MKKIINQLGRLSGLALLAAAVWSGSAAAQYPTRPITVIVAYGPGGGTDLDRTSDCTLYRKAFGQ